VMTVPLGHGARFNIDPGGIRRADAPIAGPARRYADSFKAKAAIAGCG
jgi:hypothetical protein